jgi:hypothetical protein
MQERTQRVLKKKLKSQPESDLTMAAAAAVTSFLNAPPNHGRTSQDSAHTFHFPFPTMPPSFATLLLGIPTKLDFFAFFSRISAPESLTQCFCFSS